jgi:hypothetical protein
LEEEKKKLERAKQFAVEERKWINEVVSRVDIVPDEGNYYDKLAVKPGFEFFQAMITARERLERLTVLIPETLFYNNMSYLLKNDEKTGRIKVIENPKTELFLESITSKVIYDISTHENEPATVLRKSTDHPCYMSVNLLNWR